MKRYEIEAILRENPVIVEVLRKFGEVKRPEIQEVLPENPVIVDVLPCVGFGPHKFTVVQSYVDEWRQAFPGVDVMQELRKAKAWLLANPTRAKTHRGMKRFLFNWLNKAQDQSRGADQQGQQSRQPTTRV